MAACAELATCRFLTVLMKDLPDVAELFQRRYCRMAHEDCARVRIRRLAPEAAIPDDLFPNQIERVAEFAGPEGDGAGGPRRTG
jgi:hypothetical protein